MTPQERLAAQRRATNIITFATLAIMAIIGLMVALDEMSR